MRESVRRARPEYWVLGIGFVCILLMHTLLAGRFKVRDILVAAILTVALYLFMWAIGLLAELTWRPPSDSDPSTD